MSWFDRAHLHLVQPGEQDPALEVAQLECPTMVEGRERPVWELDGERQRFAIDHQMATRLCMPNAWKPLQETTGNGTIRTVYHHTDCISDLHLTPRLFEQSATRLFSNLNLRDSDVTVKHINPYFSQLLISEQAYQTLKTHKVLVEEPIAANASTATLSKPLATANFMRHARPSGTFGQRPALTELEHKMLVAVFGSEAAGKDPAITHGPAPIPSEWKRVISCHDIAPAGLCEAALKHVLERHLGLGPHLYGISATDDQLALMLDGVSYRIQQSKIHELLQMPERMGGMTR